MVCHETYKNSDGKWVSPDEITKDEKDKFILKKDKSVILVGPSESMSKSKKNIIDPESMVNIYGADAVRWFILSDSPPEKDVQWSIDGVNASYKFLQKIWNLNNQLLLRKDKKGKIEEEKVLASKFNQYIFKTTNLIENFNLNVFIANIYEMYNLLSKSFEKEISNGCLNANLVNFMKILIPFTPHLAHECLEILGESDPYIWPKVDEKLLGKQTLKIAIQINGKTKDVIEVQKDLPEKDLLQQIKKNDKINKNLEGKKLIKKIYVQNRIINFLIK